MQRIITVGSASQDLFLEVSHITPDNPSLEPGRKYEAERLVTTMGGGALNVAHTITTLGCPAHPWSIRGNDAIGQALHQEIESRGLSTRYIQVSSTGPTAQSFILPSGSGNRPIISYRGCTDELQIASLYDELPSLQGLFLSSLPASCTPLLPALIDTAASSGTKVGTNPGLHQLKDPIYARHLLHALRTVCLCTMNTLEYATYAQTLEDHHMVSFIATHDPMDDQDQVVLTSGTYTFGDIYQALAPHTSGILVVTRGARGAFAATGDTVYSVPCAPSPVTISSVGAGDTYAGTLFYALVREIDPIPALQAAAYHSALVVNHLGAARGHVSYDLLTKQPFSFPKPTIHTISL